MPGYHEPACLRSESRVSYEVESTIETAPELGDVDVEGELVTQEGEHLILGIAGHEIEPRTDVGGCLYFSTHSALWLERENLQYWPLVTN